MGIEKSTPGLVERHADDNTAVSLIQINKVGTTRKIAARLSDVLYRQSAQAFCFVAKSLQSIFYVDAGMFSNVPVLVNTFDIAERN